MGSVNKHLRALKLSQMSLSGHSGCVSGYSVSCAGTGRLRTDKGLIGGLKVLSSRVGTSTAGLSWRVVGVA